MKKKLIFIFAFILFTSFSFSAEINILPEKGNFGPNCLIPFDIIIDTKGEKIMGTDMIIESSMEYVDFVPNQAFEYYLLPQKQTNKIIYIGAFSDIGKELLGQKTFGTIYFKSNPEDFDGYIRFIFLGTGITSDTNLSIIGGIDKLDRVGEGIYSFELEPCEHFATNVSGGFSSIDQNKYLNNMLSKFNKKAVWQKAKLLFYTYAWNVGFLLLVLIFGYCFYKKKFMLKGKKGKK